MFRISLAVLSVCVLVTFADVPRVDAATKCIHIARQRNIEALINKCGQCMIAMVYRMRPGGAKPVTRQFPVLARSSAPVPFKGSGQSRIKSERLCPRDRGQLEEAAKQPKSNKCVTLEQSGSAGAILINRCGECRAAAIQRSNDNQATGVRDYLKLQSGQRAVIPSKGYSSVGLLGEIPCPKG